jgi:hypothetical protein
LSLLALTQGDWKRGQRFAEEALKLAEDVGSARHKGWAVRELEVAASMAATEEPLPSATSSNTITVFEVILFHLIFENNDIYEGLLQEALKAANQDIDRVRCLPFAARFLVQKGKTEQGVSLLALAYQYPEFATGWLEKLPTIQRLRSNLEATLPPDAFAAAWVRGQTLSLEATVAQLLAELEKISTDATILL